MNRLRAAACAWGVGAVVFVAAALPGSAADRPPADALLARAREAADTHEFTGVVHLRWRTGAGMRDDDVAVRAVDGGLRLDDGAVVEDDGQAWIRNHTSWQTLWADTRAPRTPTVGAKYRVRIAAGPAVAGLPTRTLTISRDGHVVERYAFDRTSGLVLERTRFDDAGRVNASMAFVRLGPVRPARGRLDTPKVGTAAPQPVARPDDAHRRVGNGFVLVGTNRVGDETQLLYSDGVFTASVFTTDGSIDWDAMPAGGTDVRLDGTTARRYRTPSGTVVTWESRGRTFTCVTDASDSEQRAIVVSMRAGDDDGWTDAVRFVTAPFSWF